VGKYSTLKKTKTRDMPNAKHKEKVKETSDVLKDCREVLHDGSNEIVAQMLAFMNRVDGRLKQIETQVNKYRPSIFSLNASLCYQRII
jgi:hypothetical protein